MPVIPPNPDNRKLMRGLADLRSAISEVSDYLDKPEADKNVAADRLEEIIRAIDLTELQLRMKEAAVREWQRKVLQRAPGSEVTRRQTIALEATGSPHRGGVIAAEANPRDAVWSPQISRQDSI